MLHEEPTRAGILGMGKREGVSAMRESGSKDACLRTIGVVGERVGANAKGWLGGGIRGAMSVSGIGADTRGSCPGSWSGYMATLSGARSDRIGSTAGGSMIN